VIVDFLEGDPDRPIITGRVYNADQMPPYPLPDEKTKSTIKSYSSKGGGGFNELRFEDKKGKEQVFIYAQRNQDVRVQADRMVSIGGDTHLSVGTDKKPGSQYEDVKGEKHLYVHQNDIHWVTGTYTRASKGDMNIGTKANYKLEASQQVYLLGDMTVVIEAKTSLTLKVGGNFININASGIYINGSMVYINSGGAPGSGVAPEFQDPKAPTPADTAEHGEMSKPIHFSEKRSVVPPSSYSPQALVLKSAAQSGAPFCDV
jgi:type VI secretion system secreted protein VgrG